MTSYNALLLTAAITILTAAGCKKEEHEPLASGGNTPGKLSNLAVENFPGLAKIVYSLPEDADILYVEASYETRPGVKKTVKSSTYNNFILLDGFGDSLEHSVQIAVVSKSEKRSGEQTLTVKPKSPPIFGVLRSLRVTEDFGGINIVYTNTTEADIAIITLTDTAGGFSSVNNYYTKLPRGRYSLRGFDSKPRRFGIYVRDRWGNPSDTIISTYTPYPEKFLDKSLFRELKLPGDAMAEDAYGDMSLPRLWDGSQNGFDMWHSKPNGLPMSFTIDLGVSTILSRLTLWQRQDEKGFMYAQNNVKKFEVWVSPLPNYDGSWDNSWTKLTEYTLIKPSGLPLGQVSEADINAVKLGEELMLPYSAAIRYVRIKILEVWQLGGKTANIAEMSFWGKP